MPPATGRGYAGREGCMMVGRLGVLVVVVAALGCVGGGGPRDAETDAVPDAAGDAVGTDSQACPPALPDPASPCTGSPCCEYGEDACCGQTSAGEICRCVNGRWGCAATDACLVPECPDGGLTSPPWGHCP